MPEQPTPGATPDSQGATPNTTTTPAAPAAPAPATGDDTQLGDAGKRALQAERDARATAISERDALKAEIEKLRSAQMSDQEKAVAEARKAGATEALTRVNAQVRRSEVKAALTGAGINASVLDLAIGAPEFADLKVSDEGDVKGLADAVETFRKARADLFKPVVPAGTADSGARGGAGQSFSREQLDRMSPADYAKNRDAIHAWLNRPH